jgi:exodeoxyribonuclease-3
MKIATFNINNINRRLANLLAWLGEAEPDIVCLQELKATDGAFPSAALHSAGYEAVWRGQPTYNGVAILSKCGTPIITKRNLPGDSTDAQSRYIEAAISGVLAACLYLPNGNPQPGPKFDYKLAWFDRLIAYAHQLFAEGVPAILAGDFNVVPTDLDIYPTKSYADNALLQPESRARFARLINQGWTDAIRTLHPGQPMYTFWDYKRNRWERDAGLRIDHLLLSSNLRGHLVDAGVDKWVRAEEGASDHAPAWLVLKDCPRPASGSVQSPK